MANRNRKKESDDENVWKYSLGCAIFTCLSCFIEDSVWLLLLLFPCIVAESLDELRFVASLMPFRVGVASLSGRVIVNCGG